MSTLAVDRSKSDRKRLGQYFTGLRLARLLAALADAGKATSVLDPMVGSGDMLEAALEFSHPAATAAGIEIDSRLSRHCHDRLGQRATIIAGDAFHPDSWRELSDSWIWLSRIRPMSDIKIR